MKKVYSHGEITRLIRILRGYGEGKMASILGMTQANYSYLEMHRKTFDNALLEEIACALGVSRTTLENFDPDALLNGNGNNHNKTNSFDIEASDPSHNKDNMLALQKEQIMALKKNIVGLRRQLEEQNDTISELHNHIREQQHSIKELRQLLAQKLEGVKSMSS